MVKFKKIIEEKNSIRSSILARLRSQTKRERRQKSQEIKRRLFKTDCFKAAHTIMFYVSLGYEVDTWGMIEEALKLGKRVMVPVTVKRTKRLIPSEITGPTRQLRKSNFGVYEPKQEHIKAVPLDAIDMVIVPGIAFDRKGNRIGHGKGYFDRFLKGLPKKIPTFGLGFSFQLLDRIKTLRWDRPVTMVITA